MHHSVLNVSLFPNNHASVHIGVRERGVRLVLVDLTSDDSQYEGTGFTLRFGRSEGLSSNYNWSNDERLFFFKLNWLGLGEKAGLKLVGVAK